MLSPTMNTNGLNFWGVSWILRWRLQFISCCIRGSIILMWLIPFMFEDVLSILIKCFVSSRCAWKSLSICISFTLLFCLANFVKWWLLFYWMGFGVMDIEVSQGSSFFSEILWSFRLSHGLQLCIHRSCVWAVFQWHFLFSSLKKPFLSDEIWLWRLQRSSSRCPFSFVSSGSCCLL